MTRTGVMASSRPRTVGAAPMTRGSSGILRALLMLPAVLLLALAIVPGVAVAAEPTSGYTTPTQPTSGYTTPTTTTTATTPATTPTTGTLPSKEAEKPASTTPASETAPAKTTTTSPQSSTLPFTGFDLRWAVGFGLLLMIAGFSIVAVQRRQRRDSGR